MDEDETLPCSAEWELRWMVRDGTSMRVTSLIMYGGNYPTERQIDDARPQISVEWELVEMRRLFPSVDRSELERCPEHHFNFNGKLYECGRCHRKGVVDAQGVFHRVV